MSRTESGYYFISGRNLDVFSAIVRLNTPGLQLTEHSEMRDIEFFSENVLLTAGCLGLYHHSSSDAPAHACGNTITTVRSKDNSYISETFNEVRTAIFNFVLVFAPPRLIPRRLVQVLCMVFRVKKLHSKQIIKLILLIIRLSVQYNVNKIFRRVLKC